MKSILKQLKESNKELEKAAVAREQAEINNPETKKDRRDFLKKTAIGGITLAGMMNLSIGDTIAQTTGKVKRDSSPSDLKITDMRYALTGAMGGTAIIRIDTNQGVYGLGEVRDAADPRYALVLKGHILGLNPCNVERSYSWVESM